jgi:hypothetical protein
MKSVFIVFTSNTNLVARLIAAHLIAARLIAARLIAARLIAARLIAAPHAFATVFTWFPP